MPTMRDYVTLGRSGLRVSPICLGAMTFGEDWGFGSDVESSCRVIDAYIEAGGNFIDTANIYTKGHSEQIMGDHLCGTPSKRDRLVIATKWLGNLYAGDPNGGGAHRKALMESVEQSLRRLQTDYIDLLWMHFWDVFTPIEETMRGLDDLVAAGKLRYIGFSDTPAWKCAQAQMISQFRGWSPVIALQIEYSLLERTPEGELVPMASEMGMGITPWSPLKGGLLSGKYRRENLGQVDSRRAWMQDKVDEQSLRVIDELIAVSADASCSPAQTALAWCRQKDGVDSVIIGARTIDQLQDNMKSIEVVLTDEQMSRLDEVSQPKLGFPHDFLQRIPTVIQGGTTVNGRPGEEWDMMPKTDSERW